MEEIIQTFEEWLYDRFSPEVEHYRLKYLISDLEDLEDMTFNDIRKKYRDLDRRVNEVCFDPFNSFELNDEEFENDIKQSIKFHIEELENKQAEEFDDWDF